MLNNIVSSGTQPTVNAKEATLAELAKPAPARAEATSQHEKSAAVAPEPQELQSAVSKLNDYVQNIKRTLSFSVEEKTGATVVQVYDSETDELIRQIPAEETLKMAASIEAYNASLLIKDQA